MNPFAVKNKRSSYQICDQKIHGLSVLDYSFLALASYMVTKTQDSKSAEDLVKYLFPFEEGEVYLTHRIPFHPGVSRMNWVEVYFKKYNTTYISIKGTDPAQILDYLEDIRLWTEPVAIALLGMVFPTVKIWPKETTDIIIKGIHDFLDQLGISDDGW